MQILCVYRVDEPGQVSDDSLISAGWERWIPKYYLNERCYYKNEMTLSMFCP